MRRTILVQALILVAVVALMAAVTVSQVPLVRGEYSRAARTGLMLDAIAISCLSACIWIGRTWTRIACSVLFLVAFPLLVDCIRRGFR